jgi:hypothetical protein
MAGVAAAAKRLAAFVGHQILSTVVVGALSAMLVQTTFSILHLTNGSFSYSNARTILMLTPLCPVQAAVGLIAGVVAGRFAKSNVLL